MNKVEMHVSLLPTFTEKQIDEACNAMVAGAVYEMPERLYEFLTESQLADLKSSMFAHIKTCLLFDLMNHLEGFE